MYAKSFNNMSTWKIPQIFSSGSLLYPTMAFKNMTKTAKRADAFFLFACGQSCWSRDFVISIEWKQPFIIMAIYYSVTVLCFLKCTSFPYLPVSCVSICGLYPVQILLKYLKTAFIFMCKLAICFIKQKIKLKVIWSFWSL